MRLIAAISAILCSLFFSTLPVAVEAAEQTLTQRDWMINLVDTLGYSFGLPDTPQDADYIKLLEGGRSFRFEAETYRHPDDLVAINDFTSFGEFSGTGWVSAISAPTKLRINFLLPHSGTYHLFARVRLPGHILMLDGQKWEINENSPKFQRVDLGEATLVAGLKELVVAMPANGSIDYIEFLAPPLTAIMPLSGWEPDALLTYADLAVTTIRALELQNLLPLHGDKILIEAEESSEVKTFNTDQRHLGEPHGGFWLRSGASGGIITLPFPVETGAVYTLNLIAAGSRSLIGTLDAVEAWQADFPPYLKENAIGTWYLSSGRHELKIELPPRGGIDLLTLLKRRSTAADYQILAGLPAGDSVKTDDVNRLLTLLSRLHNPN